MRTWLYVLWVLALTLFVALILVHGLAEVGTALSVAGWGLVWLALYHLFPLAADTLGWRSLFSRGRRPSLTAMLWMRWIGESVNTLLPAAQIGGDVVRARLLAQAGTGRERAAASMIVDLTAAVASQVLFALLGVALLLWLGAELRIAGPLLVGIALFALMGAGFYFSQQLGLFFKLARALERLAAGRVAFSFTIGAAALDEAVIALYRQDRRFWLACLWHEIGWLLGIGEVWLAMFLLGHPVTLVEATMLESVGQAVRGAGFAIPGALGVQEAAYIVLGGIVGIAPETALALSLAKRVRELALGIPGLIGWQLVEGRALWRRKHLSHS